MARITLHIKHLTTLSEKIPDRVLAQAAVRTINRTIVSTKTKASNIIRNDEGWKVKKRDLDPRLDVKKANARRLTAEIHPDRVNTSPRGARSIPIIDFGAKEVRNTSKQVLTRSRSKHGGLATTRSRRSGKGSGVTVQVKKGGPKAYFPRAFIAQMPGSGKVSVFFNTEYPKWQGKIQEIRTISVTSMFVPHIPRLGQHALKVFKKEWEHEIKRAMRKHLGP